MINVKMILNLRTDKVISLAQKAGQKGTRDTVVAIHRDTVHDSPYLTGHNRRSMTAEVSGMGTVARGVDSEPEKVVDDSKIQGAVYSTSGYGGYLETGTHSMGARPYIKPSYDRHIKELPGNIEKHFKEL